MKKVPLVLAVMGFVSLGIGLAVSFANPLVKFLTIQSYGRIVYPIRAVVDINPNILNLKSGGKWITAYIELPTGYKVGDTDVSSILLNDSIPADVGASTTVGDHDDDGIQDLTVKFDRALIIDLLNVGEAKLTITGEISGIPFEGSDTIRVIEE